MENIVVGKLIKQFVEVVLEQDDDTVEYRHLVEVYDRLDGTSSTLEKGGIAARAHLYRFVVRKNAMRGRAHLYRLVLSYRESGIVGENRWNNTLSYAGIYGRRAETLAIVSGNHHLF